MAPPTLAPAVSRLWSTAMLLSFTQVAAASTGLPGTYSSLTYNVESGDLVGYEVRLIPTNQGTKAVVQVAEGDAGRIYIVDVEDKVGAVSFEVPLISGRHAKFIGKVTVDGLNGTIEFPSGDFERVHLTRGISYWER